jgi:Transmembrane domain of unknown function (DUF3566)
MAVIARISPGSAIKVGLVLYAFLGLILGILVALISLMAGGIAARLGQSAPPGLSSAFGIGGGVGAIIVMPIVYGIVGAIAFGLFALIYNVVAGWVGGLEVDLK